MLRELPIVLALSLVPSAGSADIEEWCSEPEMLGEVELGVECYAYVVLVAEVLGAAGPCWDQISLDLPTDAWQTQRDWCEDQAHLVVCGQIPCY